MVQLDRCSRDTRRSCLRRIHGSLHEDIVANLRRLTFASMADEEGKKRKKGNGGGGGRSRHHFSSKGRLVANKQQIYSIDRNEGLEQVRYTDT